MYSTDISSLLSVPGESASRCADFSIHGSLRLSALFRLALSHCIFIALSDKLALWKIVIERLLPHANVSLVGAGKCLSLARVVQLKRLLAGENQTQR